MDLPEGLRLEDYEKSRKIIVDFIGDYVARAGAKGVVLGLSGGIDSSLVAALACEAIDPDKVYGVVTNNYVRGGGDGYKMFATDGMNVYDMCPDLADVMAEYMAAKGSYTAYLDGSITQK